ncbi:MAG: DNA primase [Firmicutes bacterium]|nr:DNA primase [Bacillota bacterium]
MRFPQDVIDEIRSRVDIAEVVGEYVALRKSGRNWVGLCPFHAEKTPSFTVSPERQLFYCFGCQAGGDVFAFVMKRTGMGFAEAVEHLARRAGIDLLRFAASPEEEERLARRGRLLEVHRLAAGFFARALESGQGRAARAYLERRGISAEMIQRYQLGYAPPGDSLARFLRDQGIDDDVAVEAGLIIPASDGRQPFPRFRDRLMFPIADSAGRIVGFGGRVLGERKRAPKYLNSPETPLFSKGRVLYGFHLAKDAIAASGTAIIVEGYTDCISLVQHGLPNTVASLGTAFTEAQAQLLARVAQRAVIAFDADAAGQAAAERSLNLLRRTGLRVAVMELSPGQDPDQFAQTRGREALQEAVRTAVPLLEYKLNKVLPAEAPADPEGKVRAVEAALAVLGEVESPVEREAYTEVVARRIAVPVASVRAELGRWQAMRSSRGKMQYTAGKNRHNNRGFHVHRSEHTSRGRPVVSGEGGNRLASAEQVVLRHVLAAGDCPGARELLNEREVWSSPMVGRAAALLRDRLEGPSDPAQWLSSLPPTPEAAWLRDLWARTGMARIAWEEARRELLRERAREKLGRLEAQLGAVMKAVLPDGAAGMLAKLLVEYKRLRSDLVGG